MPDRFSRLVPNDNVYLIETADDLPEVLSQWTLYNLQFDPGSGTGLYFSPDGISLVRLAAGVGVGFTGFGIWRFRTETGTPPASGQIRFNNSDPELATELFISEINDGGTDVSVFLALLTAGSFLYIQEQSLASNSILVEVSTNVDSGTFRTIGIANVEQQGAAISQNTRVIVVGTPVGGGGGGGVTTFEGRAGAVVAVQDDYEGFFLVKGNFVDQLVLGDVEFSGTVEMTNIFGFKLGASCELELRNSGDTSTTFIQNLGPIFQFGIAGADFGDGVFQITPSSFAKVESPPIFIKEQSVAEVDAISFGQLWIRDDSPNTLMFTDDAGNDFTVDVTAA